MNCEIELNLPLSKHCIIFEIYSTPEVPTNSASYPFTDTVTEKIFFSNCEPFIK